MAAVVCAAAAAGLGQTVVTSRWRTNNSILWLAGASSAFQPFKVVQGFATIHVMVHPTYKGGHNASYKWIIPSCPTYNQGYNLLRIPGMSDYYS